jgi:hypothetical protein
MKKPTRAGMGAKIQEALIVALLVLVLIVMLSSLF